MQCCRDVTTMRSQAVRRRNSDSYAPVQAGCTVAVVVCGGVQVHVHVCECAHGGWSDTVGET